MPDSGLEERHQPNVLGLSATFLLQLNQFSKIVAPFRQRLSLSVVEGLIGVGSDAFFDWTGGRDEGRPIVRSVAVQPR
jgi:hypothetical protein